ncbi:MAG: T9SS type A sorting domain-containing protein [Bacteroidetes bacterium]|jgi:hypothetical protein|nr:T9SS type A sorting domain-containing protein [Bacteroidota bacterium]
MKTIYTFLLITLGVVWQPLQGQEILKIGHDVFSELPRDVASAVSPDGTVYRAELANLTESWHDDTFVLAKLDENLQAEAELLVSGYPLNLAMIADNENVYVNIQFFEVNNYPISLPEVGLIATDDYTNGTLIVAFTHDMQLNWYEFIGTNSYSGRWKCAAHLSHDNILVVNALTTHESSPIQSEIRAYLPNGELAYVLEQNVLVYSIKDDLSGNIYFTGSCADNNLNFNGTTVSNTYDDNIFVAKYNPEGSLDWVNLVETFNCTFPDIAVNSSSEIYLSAQLLGGIYFFDDLTHQVNEYQQFVLARINQSGNFDLLKPLTMNNDELAITRLENNAYLAIDQQDNLHLSGLAFGPLTWNNGEQYNEFGPAGFVAKLNPEAMVEWVIQTTENTQSPGIQHLSAVSGNTIYLTGKSNNYLSFDDILVVNPGGFFSWIAEVSLEDTQTALFSKNSEQPLIYPNPTNSNLHISYPKSMSEVFQLKLYDISGKVLYTIRHPEQQLTIDVSGWTKGIYMLNSQTEHGNFNYKLVVTE